MCSWVPLLYAHDEPVQVSEPQRLYDEALMAKEDGELPRARKDLEVILHQYPDYHQIGEVRQEWAEIMWHLIHVNMSAPEALEYTVKSADTLGKIAKAHATTVELIRQRNHLSSDTIRPGQKLSLWTAPITLVVNKSHNRLNVQLNNQVIKVYPVSTGKSDSITPVGDFVIRDRYPHPTWFHKGVVVPAGSPENFLGTRWLGFNIPKYGIHGTIYPELIGQSVSGGCVRMRNEDVEELYDIIPVGTKVRI